MNTFDVCMQQVKVCKLLAIIMFSFQINWIGETELDLLQTGIDLV